MIIGTGIRGRTAFRGQTGFLAALYLERLSYWESLKTDSVINITRLLTEIFSKANTKKRKFLPSNDK